MAEGSFAGRSIPNPGFVGDSGAADPELVNALAAYAADPGRAPAVLWALSRARVLVPVVAVATEQEEPADGLRREKSTDMALVTVQRPDGERALPVFSSIATLAAWRADARPVPVESARAALSAAAEGARALLVDPAGPVRFVVSGPALRALAEGTLALPLYADPEVEREVRRGLASVPGVRSVRLQPAPDADLRVVVTLAAGEDAAAVLTSAAAALQGLVALRARTFAGIDLAAEPEA